jgi:hypothetical protein
VGPNRVGYVCAVVMTVAIALGGVVELVGRAGGVRVGAGWDVSVALGPASPSEQMRSTIRRSKVQQTGTAAQPNLSGGSSAGGTSTGTLSNGGAAVTCNQTVSTRAAVLTALTTSGNAGQTVCVNANITGAEISTTTDMASEMRLVAQPRDGTVNMVAIACNGCSNVTVEGFEFTGDTSVDRGVWVGGTGAVNFHWIKNNCHDLADDCMEIQGTGHTGLWAIGNTISRYEYTGAGGEGYGIRGDTPISGAKFNYNECLSTHLTNGGADCMEIGQCATCDFIGNWFDDILDRGNGSHADFLMVWNDSSDITIRDNRGYMSHNALISPDTDRATIDNNLFVQMTNGCVDADGPNGSSDPENHPLQWDISNNTVIRCGLPDYGTFIFDDWRMGGPLSGRGGNTFRDNIIGDMGCVVDSFGTGNVDATGNVFKQATMPCSMPSGSNRANYTVTFSGGTTGGDYLPTNLPAGYEDAGYRDAPVGPSGCGAAEGCIYD